MINFSERDGALVFRVRVVPRASKSEVVGEHCGDLRVRVAAPPVEGAANKELIRTLARYFDVPTRAVKITGGQTSKLKQVRVVGCDSEKLIPLLQSKEKR